MEAPKHNRPRHVGLCRCAEVEGAPELTASPGVPAVPELVQGRRRREVLPITFFGERVGAQNLHQGLPCLEGQGQKRHAGLLLVGHCRRRLS
eukprot:15279539-Alexandrium_andersonii.AAC.1